MADLTQGYLGHGHGNCLVVEQIASHPYLNYQQQGQFLARSLFKGNFMPYAKTHWAYEASNCNCEMLANALLAVWDYIATVKRPAVSGALPQASKYNIDGLVSKPLHFFAGAAHGNVRRAEDGALDGRCLFPIHWVSRIGLEYYDPTYDRSTANAEDSVERHIRRLGAHMAFWISLDGQKLYAHSTDAAPRFADSWVELNAAGYITAADWKTKTARTLHTRSSDLAAVDNAIQIFEQQGWAGFVALKTAFTYWKARNPQEAAARNVDNCVTGLGGFLGVPVH
jgi:hypothetical protein